MRVSYKKLWKMLIDRDMSKTDLRLQSVPDDRKSGGAIVVTSGKVKKISATNGTIVMADGCIIPIADVMDIVI